MKFQSKLINIANSCCLADCYMEAAARYNMRKLTEADKARILLEANARGFVDDECFVKDPVGLMQLTVPGTHWTVKKCRATEAEDYYAVRYACNGKGHWVLFGKHSGLLYNGLDYSNCVAKGIPDFDDVRSIKQL